MKWEKAELSVDLLESAEDVLSSIRGALDTLASFKTASADLLALISSLSAELDTRATAIEALLTAARDSLDDLLAPAAGHALLITPVEPFLRPAAAPYTPVGDLGGTAASIALYRADLQALLGDGGNHGVYRKFVESLYDEDDYSRPKFADDAYVACGVLLVGSDTYADVLNDALMLAGRLGGQFGVPEDGYFLPVPQNTRAKIIPAPAKTLARTDNVAGFPFRW